MKKIILTAISLASILACSDFLYSEPVESISITQQLGSKEGMLKSLNGAYYQLRSTYFSEAPLTYGDLMSGNLKFSPASSKNIIVDVTVANVYQFDDQKIASNLALFYSDTYQLINNVNLILQYADQLPDASVSEISEIKAEALALRAFAHFHLFKYYAQNYTYTADASHLGIVYNTEPLKVGVDYPFRKTAAENFISLQNDIDQSISLFQPSHAIPDGQKKNFMNIDAARILAAEIALWKNDWQKAADYSNDVIQNSLYHLTPPNEVSVNWAVSESIFEIANNNNNDFPASLIYNFISASSKSSYVATDDIYSLYSSNDNRKSLFETKNLETNTNSGLTNIPYHFTRKYKINTGSLIYRLSLAYFIHAEASLRSGNTLQALNDINIIRNRAGLTNLTSINMDILLEEKRKEFVFENQYFFDLIRNHRNIVRNNGCISTNCSPAYPNDKFVLPIPQSTISINSAMQQNPGY
nr:RagB/SusD family nutrient uptake outer membrane protein [uncultured Chryseobacterium sp.]